MDEQKFDWLRKDMDELKADVKELLADRNKRMGMSIVVSAVVSGFLAITIALLNK